MQNRIYVVEFDRKLDHYLYIFPLLFEHQLNLNWQGKEE
jgi:hypothetical protein